MTKCCRAVDGLSLLRENESKFSIVITALQMPDMDEFQLLEVIRLEMDLHVVMISSDYSRDVVMKAVIIGASDYLVKPVRKEEISVLWQHVIRKHKNGSKLFMLTEIDSRNKSSHEEENCGGSNHVKNDEEEGSKNDIVSLKKQRMVWTPELHERFIAVVNEMGLRNAVPKKILKLMNVPGLTRENVASHLQKYRIHCRRKMKNMGKKFCNPSAQIENVTYPFMVGNSTSPQAYATISNQLRSQSSAVSEDQEGLSVVACGTGIHIAQENYYDQPWSYGLQETPATHGGAPAH